MILKPLCRTSSAIQLPASIAFTSTPLDPLCSARGGHDRARQCTDLTAEWTTCRVPRGRQGVTACWGCCRKKALASGSHQRDEPLLPWRSLLPLLCSPPFRYFSTCFALSPTASTASFRRSLVTPNFSDQSCSS